MSGFIAVVAAVLCVGTAAAMFLWRRLDDRREHEPLELVTAGAVVGLALWLGASWILAYSGLLVRPAVIVLAAAFVVVAVVVVARGLRVAKSQSLRGSLASALVLLPVLLWVAYALWRGVVLPPANHDALAYHLPKAALLMNEHRFAQFAVVDARINQLPWNYELLLADILVAQGRDTITEWVSTVFFVLLLVATAAIARRWWGRGIHVPLATLVVAATPVLLLNSGADKADLMAVFCATAAILFAARWVVEGGRTAFGLTTLALAAGAGVKPNVAAVGIAIAPFLLYRFVREFRRMRARDVASAALLACAAFVLCGNLVYVDDLTRQGLLIQTPAPKQQAILQYGDWQNLWQVPYLLLAVPFSKYDDAVWVPWLGEMWFWPHYELFFSHYGELFTVLVVALPLAVFFFRRAAPDPIRRERNIATIVAVLAVAISLPVATRPVGMFAAFPRYFAFVIPFIVCWTVAPAIRALASHPRSRRWTEGVAVIVIAYFGLNAFLCAVEDRFAPLAYAQWAAENPGTRMVYFTQKRAASYVDRQAGPTDTVAIDGSFDAWSYPAWGAKLTRTVIFLPSGTTPATIPGDVQWVVLDHSWSSLWGATTTMGNFWKNASRGPQAPEYRRLARALLADPHWKPTYLDPTLGQAVFRRVR